MRVPIGDPVLVTRPRSRNGTSGLAGGGSGITVHRRRSANTRTSSPRRSGTWTGSPATCRTLAITATGNDNETTTANVYLFGPARPSSSITIAIRTGADHDPLDNMADLDSTLPNSPGGTDPLVMKQDLNVGQDYAVRVQELKGSIKGIYDDGNIKVRLDIWGLKKEGTRQTNLTAMCYNRNVSGAALPPDHLGWARSRDVHGRKTATFSARRSGSTGSRWKSSPSSRPVSATASPSSIRGPCGVSQPTIKGIPLLRCDRIAHLQCDNLE